jgi:hypothetical protein
MKRFKSYINESVELDESIAKMSDARLKFHVLKNVPHGSYTKKELSAEHDRRKKTGGAEYNAVKPSLNEENIDEAVNAKKIAADHDAGHSIDVIVQKHLNKKGDNKDEILKAIQAHRWNKRMKKEEAEQIDELKKSTLGSYVNRAADDISHIQRDITSSGTQSPDYKNLSRMRKNRKAGIARAVTSLTKEEVELDEARKSDSYQFTHKPGDAESEKRLADLKKSVKGTGKRVVLQGRLGKDNPNAHKYSKDAPSAKYKDGKRVNSDVSGKSGGHSHQRIQKADAAHHDVYVYDRNESVELDEISKATLRKVGGQMLRKGLSDDPKADKHMKYANLASAKLYPNQYKNSPLKAKVNATEEVESLDELSKKTLGSYVKKAAGDAVTKAYRAGDVRDKDSGKNYMKALGRQIGISTATSKLAKEEVEELDELKKSTLASYIKKATPDAMDQGVKGMDFKNENRPKHFNKAMSRMTGIKKAADKLAKEEVEIYEATVHLLPHFTGNPTDKNMANWKKHADEHGVKMSQHKDDDGATIHKFTGSHDAIHSLMKKKKVPGYVMRTQKEEVELAELKKSTIGSYVKKAAGSMAGKTAVAAAQASSSMGKTSPDIKRGIVNRMKGITRATDKLTKEEADLEEKLVGGQKKLDHNKNGKIDSHDFHLMRKKKMKEEVEGLDEISRDLARRYIRKIADKTNTGELSVKQVEKRRPGLNLAGKKAYPSISGEPKVRATD